MLHVKLVHIFQSTHNADENVLNIKFLHIFLSTHSADIDILTHKVSTYISVKT